MKKNIYKVKCRSCGKIHEFLGHPDYITFEQWSRDWSTIPIIIHCDCQKNDNIFADLISYSKQKLD